MKLSVRIPIIIGAVMLVTSASIGILSIRISSRTLEEYILSAIGSQTEANSEIINVILNGQLDVLGEIATRIRIRSMDWSIIQPTLVPDIPNIGALDMAMATPDGVSHYVLDNTNVEIGDRNYFIRAMNGEKNIELVFSRISSTIVCLFAVPIFESDKPGAPVIGVLVARKDGGRALSDLVSSLKNSMSTAYCFLVDKDGTFIAHPNTELVTSRFNPIKAAENDPSLKPLGDLVATALREKNGISRYTYEGKTLLGRYTEVPGYSWLLFSSIERKEVDSHLTSMIIIILVIGTGFVLAGLIIAFLIGRSIAKPVIHVAETLKDISEGDTLKHLKNRDLTQKLTVQSKDEIGEMANYIKHTVEKIKSMMASLEQHDRLLDTENEAAAILLANNDVNAFETPLIKCFELIGRCMDVDRVQIWRNEEFENELHFVLRYEWLNDYGKRRKPVPLGLRFPYNRKEDWHRKFKNHEYINSPVRELPAEDRALLEPYDIKSIMILPMFLEGNFWGFFSLDDCRHERTFSEEEIDVLTSTGLMMISAVNRNIQALIAREAEERIQSIFEATPLTITIWDPETYALIDCNMEAVRVVGLSDKKLYMEKFAEMSPEYQPGGKKTSDRFLEIFDIVMRDGIYHYNWDQCTIDGEVIPFQVTTVRIKQMGGYIVISYGQDVREVKTANEKISEAEERMRIMFNAMPLCANYRTKTEILECNSVAIDLFGLTDKKEYMEKFRELSPEYQPDGRLSRERGEAFLDQAIEEGYVRFEWMHQKMDGEPIPCEVTLVKVKYKNDFAIAAYIRDLREQKAMFREMQKARIAEESNKAKSDFLAKMSHEIRTPMNAILGIAEIQLQSKTHPPDTKEAFERIYNSGDLLLGIINDILDLSKIEAGKLDLTPDQYDIASLIHDTVQLNIMRYENKPIKFILDVKEDLPLFMIGDELRIKQILNNLLSNAFKYTDDGIVKLTVYSEPVSHDSKRTLVFTVKDTGQGMTAEQVEKLGTEYSRFNMEANRKTEGTGLGMNITLNLIHLMNGSFSVESAPGAGSTFTVRLPQDSIGSTVIGQEIADNLMGLNLDNSVKFRNFQIKKEFMPYGHVLIVDDVETNLYVTKGLLAPYGLLTETTMSGFETIDKIKDGSSYDIIFMDHMMPKMDGIETTKILRELGYSKPIVALTANAIAGQAAMFIENGFDDFISKPIDIRQLNMTLNKFIRDKYPIEVVEAARKQKNSLLPGDEQKKSLDPLLAEIFIRDAQKALTEMEAINTNKCRRENDLAIFVINVHSMKSALANIGEIELSAEALKLELAGREKNIDLIITGLPQFMDKLRSVIEKLKPQEADDENNTGDNQFLKEKLLAIREGCMSYNKKAAKDKLAEIRRETWPRYVNEQINAISAHLLHSDFDEAIQAIDDYVQRL